MKNMVIHSEIINFKEESNKFGVILQDKMGFIQFHLIIFDKNGNISSNLLSEINTEIWTFTRISLNKNICLKHTELKFAIPDLTSNISVYSFDSCKIESQLKISSSPEKGKPPENGLVTSLKFLDNGKFLVSAHESGLISVFNCEANLMLNSYNLPKEFANVLSFEFLKISENQYRIYVGLYGPNLFIFEFNPAFKTLLKIAEINEASTSIKPGISDIKFRPDQKIFFTCGYDFRIKCYSTKSNKLLAVLKYHTKNMNQICCHENKVIGCSDDGFITEWEIY